MMSESRTPNLGSPGPSVFPLVPECTRTSGIYRKSKNDTIHAAFGQALMRVAF
jgi:hypothetical protein